METDAQRVVKPWTQDTPPPEGGGVCNISDRYNFVTLFRRKWQEGPPSIPPEPCFDRLVIINQRYLQVLTSFLLLGLGFSGGHWQWQQRTPGLLSSGKSETPHLLMGTSDFDRDGDRKKDYWNYDSLRGWWHTYEISANGGNIRSKGTASVKDRNLNKSGPIWTGSRTVSAKTSLRRLGCSWFWEINYFVIFLRGGIGIWWEWMRIKWYGFLEMVYNV